MNNELHDPKATGNPYVGPQSFRRDDPFYGRDRETGDLADLLIAERVMLLYSPSGAGKSSLIAAGLIPRLEAEHFEVLPIIRLMHEVPPDAGLTSPPRNRYVLSTLLSLEEGLPRQHQRRIDELDAMTIRQYLASWPDLDHQPGNEVLLLDQFEEVITADPVDHDAKAEFFTDLGIALRDRKLWVLFSIREDFLAELDPYARFVPTRFSNRYRLNLLTVDQALEATIRPAADRGVEFREVAALKLVDDLRRVRVQRAGGVNEELGPTIEPVQLQVACREMWNHLDKNQRVIDVPDVETLGNVDMALAAYYADQVAATASETGVSERALRDWFEKELVTPQGIRGQVLHGPRQDGGFSERPVKFLTDTHLVRAESRRGATWYELAHDRLIGPVMEDNARWRKEHISYYEQLAALWDEQNRPEQALLAGAELAAGEQWAAVNFETLAPHEREFLDVSRRVAEQAERGRRATKRSRRLIAIVVVACLLTAGFAVWAWYGQQQAAKEAEQRATDFAISSRSDDLPALYDYGDDPGLDSLWDSCAAGEMADCDSLYWESEGGSEYESFGASCGERGATLNGDCASLPFPYIYGDDEVLDELADACSNADWAACDKLFLDSPSGSAYEAWGATCGDQGDPVYGFCEENAEEDLPPPDLDSTLGKAATAQLPGTHTFTSAPR